MTAPGSDPEDPRWQRPVPRVEPADWWLGFGLFVLALVSWLLGQSLVPATADAANPWLAVAVLAGLNLPLALRRQYPLAVMAEVTVAYVAFGELAIPEIVVSQVSLFAAFYAVGAWERSRVRARWVRVVVLVVMAVWLLVKFPLMAEYVEGQPTTGLLTPAAAQIALTLLINLLYFAGAWWFGDHAWNAAREQAITARRTRQLQDERSLVARQAVTIERMRVARELHDAVAHHVSLMGVQTAAARALLASDPARATGILEQVEESARSAVSELYSLLGTLRDDESSPAAADPTPTLEQLPDLVGQTAAAGLDVDLQHVGPQRPVPAPLALTAYRVVQESLTNVLKHAGPGVRAQVRLRWSDAELQVEISDNGSGKRLRSPASGAGLGLPSMRERVLAMGGSLTAGPRVGEGFLVRAVLPLSPGSGA